MPLGSPDSGQRRSALWIKRTPSERLRLAAEVVLAYVVARWELRRNRLPTALSRLRGGPPLLLRGSEDAHALVAATRIGWAVRRTLSVLPADSGCLVQAAVLTRLLNRRGIPNRIVIGVRVNDGFSAHAWVECWGRPVLPASEAEQEFDRMVEI